MTDHARAIEAGARAMIRHRHWSSFWSSEEARELAESCIEAAIASGELVRASAGQPFDKIKAGLEEAVAVAKGEQPAASIYVHGHKYVPASAVAAERERCAAIIQAECDRILSKQTPTDDPFSDASAINSNLRMMAVVLPDLVEKLRSPAPASGEFVVVPSFKVGDRVTHTGRQESGTVTSTKNGCVIVEFDIPTPSGYRSVGSYDAVWFRTHPNMLLAATKDGERK